MIKIYPRRNSKLYSFRHKKSSTTFSTRQSIQRLVWGWIYTRGSLVYVYVDEGTVVVARIHKGGPRARIKSHASIKRKLMSIQPMFQ